VRRERNQGKVATMTRTHSFALFDTAIGRCGIAWSERGVTRVAFPERSETATRARLLRRLPEAREAAPPPMIASIIEGIVALAAGEKRSLADAMLDMDGVPEFERRVYETALRIPPGETLTYGDIAIRLGDRLLARDVGQALGRNPFPIIVPCHRVLAAGNRIGGFSAPGGSATKLRLLAIEGARVEPAPERRPKAQAARQRRDDAAPTLFELGGKLGDRM
jgi:methylated-DNA-[protein]-cysteine S-methyltransferase